MKKSRLAKTSFISLLSVAALSQISVENNHLSFFNVKSVNADEVVEVNATDQGVLTDTEVVENATLTSESTVDKIVSTTVVETPSASFDLTNQNTASVVSEVGSVEVLEAKTSEALSNSVALAATDPIAPDDQTEDVADAKLRVDIGKVLDDLEAMIASGDIAAAKESYELADTFQGASLEFYGYKDEIDQIPNVKIASVRLEYEARNAAIYQAIYGTPLPTGPVVTTRTEVIAHTTKYIADDTLAYGQRQTVVVGVDGEKTYTTTDGVEDAGVVTKAMVAEEIRVGTKPTVETVTIAKPADVEEADATLAKGTRVLKTAGSTGSITTTTTYSMDATTGVVTANTPTVETVAASPDVYRVGTKEDVPVPVVTTRTEVIAHTTKYIADDTLAYGQRQTVVVGVDGEKTYTTTDGVEDAGVVTKAMVAEEIRVGTKPTVETVTIAKPADVEEADATLAKGTRVLKTAGSTGSTTTTTTYSMDATTGVVTANTPTVETVAASPDVYRVGTKEDVIEIVEEIVEKTKSFGKVVINNPDLLKGISRQVRLGKNGIIEVTYKIVKVNGLEISREIISEKEIEKPVDEIVEIGTKEPVENQNQKVIKANESKMNSTDVKKVENKGELPKTGEIKESVFGMFSVIMTGLFALVTFLGKRERK
ncbi:G5 domain-containing protein [Streptococcus uberis]|uniref:G5 domain-containing protein n=6 Tax=Streptococcus uberis TaxID=1349 RepID=UPI002EB81D31|nr:G5 domain-containing protein [Streptococcus uberis]